MIIQSSDIAMASERKYQKKVKQSSKITNTMVGNPSRKNIQNYGMKLEFSEEGLEMLKNNKDKLSVDMNEEKQKEVNSSASMMQTQQTQQTGGFIDSIEDIRRQTLHSLLRLLRLLSGGKDDDSIDELDELYKQEPMNRNIQGISGFLGINVTNIGAGTTNNNGLVTWERTIEHSSSYKETENTSFLAKGIAVTADGRTLDFNIDVEMTRSFMEKTTTSFSDTVTYQLKDPLVIHLNSNPDSISDQKFLFDIDADGKEEEISMLNKESGFLALDKNGDGKINDGSELFGTKSGNGFEDLAVYDMDKNGWIDEKDPIFNQLRIWLKDETGKDILIGLGDADIGAIYLGNVNTQFNLTAQEDNSLKGVIKSSGIYLKESTGQAGIVQQIDMAIEK